MSDYLKLIWQQVPLNSKKVSASPAPLAHSRKQLCNVQTKFNVYSIRCRRCTLYTISFTINIIYHIYTCIGRDMYL